MQEFRFLDSTRDAETVGKPELHGGRLGDGVWQTGQFFELPNIGRQNRRSKRFRQRS